MPLLQTQSYKSYKDEFSKRFSSFAKKSPVVLSMVIKIERGEEGALIKHVNSGKTYFFPFPIGEGISVKDFIAKIKNLLSSTHYPRVIEEILEKHEFTPEELALQLEIKSLDELSRYEMRVVGTRQFRIDKCLMWRNIFILVLEQSSFSDDKIGSIYRYKMNMSPVTFLRNYRSGKYKNLEEASAAFFSEALLVDEIKKDDEE
jgi:hypothetical protein